MYAVTSFTELLQTVKEFTLNEVKAYLKDNDCIVVLAGKNTSVHPNAIVYTDGTYVQYPHSYPKSRLTHHRDGEKIDNIHIPFAVVSQVNLGKERFHNTFTLHESIKLLGALPAKIMFLNRFTILAFKHKDELKKQSVVTFSYYVAGTHKGAAFTDILVSVKVDLQNNHTVQHPW